MTRSVRIRGEKIPVERKSLCAADGLAYKRTKSDKRPVRRRIVLRKNLRGVKQLSTLLHECLHQIHIGLSERTVLRLEEALVELVLENPELFCNRLWEEQ